MTIGRTVAAKEKEDIIEYANSQSIKAVNLSIFDGDPQLLKKETHTIAQLRNNFPEIQKVYISVSADLLDDDSAETRKSTIFFNRKALRDSAITTRNIMQDNYFAARAPEDIAAHEFGHLWAAKNGKKVLNWHKNIL